MPNNWKKYKLEDVCVKITDGSHFSPKEIKDGQRIIASVKDMVSCSTRKSSLLNHHLGFHHISVIINLHQINTF
jgi:hypothetical protein